MLRNEQVYGEPEFNIPNELSFGKYVIGKFKENGDKVALINAKTGEEMTYRQLLESIVRIGNGLRRLGVGPGVVVALFSENCSELLTITVAAAAIGATVTFLNVKYTQDEMLHVLNISKPRLIFCSRSALESRLKVLLQVTFIERIVQINGEVIGLGVEPIADIEGVNSDVDKFMPASVKGSADVAFIFYSSGTTGLPKGVMLTHRNVLHGTLTYNYSSKSKVTVLTVVPWCHVYGLLTTLQYMASGDLVVYLTNLIPDEYIATIQKYQISELPTVPPIIHILAKSPLIEQYDLSSVRHVLSAAAPLSGNIMNNARKNLPNCKGIYQGYGMTETTLTIFKENYNNNADRNTGSCGTPLPGVIAKVVDIASREKLGPNERGEICVTGPTIMRGYVSNIEATRDLFDEDGFVKTGDVGYYDNEGYFYVIDRLKEIIKYKGQQVAPALVEAVLMEHPEVAECGVVGTPHELAGDLPTAFVVRRPGSALTEQELLTFTAARLSPITRLRGGIIFVEEIPKNGSGKILRKELRIRVKELNRFN